jgi:hypothetical protein
MLLHEIREKEGNVKKRKIKNWNRAPKPREEFPRLRKIIFQWVAWRQFGGRLLVRP